MLTEEQKKLVTDNHNLIYYCVPSYDRDELYDVAAIALCKAAATYNKDASKFTTYAIKCITNELRLYHRKIAASKRIPVDLVCSYDITTEEGLTLINLLSDSVNVEEEVITKTFLKSTIESFDSMRKDIVHYLMLGYKQQEIADATGYSQGQVSRIIKEIKEIILNGDKKRL